MSDDFPPTAPVQWLVETEVKGETRVAIVWAQHYQRAQHEGALVLEQPLHELVRARQAVFKGFSSRAA